MRGLSFKIVRIFGIDIEIHVTLVFMFGLLTWILSGAFAQQLPEYSSWAWYILATSTAIIFFLSILFHEMAHSLVAKRYGTIVEKITLMLFGGQALMASRPNSPKAEFLLTLAGPLSNVFLSAAFLGLAVISGHYPWPTTIFTWLFWINLFFAVFNIIPIFPMDGGRVMRSLLWFKSRNLVWATKLSKDLAKIFTAILLVAIYFLSKDIFTVIFTVIWVGAIMFLIMFPAGENEYRWVVYEEKFKGLKARDVMDEGPLCLITNNAKFFCSPDDDVFEIVKRLSEKDKETIFVRDQEKIIGAIDSNIIFDYLKQKDK